MMSNGAWTFQAYTQVAPLVSQLPLHTDIDCKSGPSFDYHCQLFSHSVPLYCCEQPMRQGALRYDAWDAGQRAHDPWIPVKTNSVSRQHEVKIIHKRRLSLALSLVSLEGNYLSSL